MKLAEDSEGGLYYKVYVHDIGMNKLIGFANRQGDKATLEASAVDFANELEDAFGVPWSFTTEDQPLFDEEPDADCISHDEDV